MSAVRRVTLLSAFWLLLALGTTAHARSVQLDGAVVEAPTLDALGRIDGVVLRDHSYLRFHPASVEAGVRFESGDHVSVSGSEIFSTPNRVLERVVVRRGDATIVDDVPITASGKEMLPSVSSSADSKFPVRLSAQLFSVGAQADGTIDRLILGGGVTIEIPASARVAAGRFSLGETLTIAGAATSASGGQFVTAMSVVGGGEERLVPRAPKGAKWELVRGVIKQTQSDPHGKVQGFTLADGRIVRLQSAMDPYSQADKFAASVQVEVAGPVGGDKAVTTELVVILAENTVIDTTGAIVGRRGGRRR